MKKLVSLVLVVIMLFSVTSMCYAADSIAITAENYTDYLEEKYDESNIFTKLIIRLIVIGLKFGLLDINILNDWFDDAPNNDEKLPPAQNDKKELALHNSQTLPITFDNYGLTIKDINITREFYSDIRNVDGYSQVQKYRYLVKIKGNINPVLCTGTSVEIQFFSSLNDGSELRYYPLKTQTAINIDSTLIIDEYGNFEYECYQYNMFFDYDTYHIAHIEYM